MTHNPFFLSNTTINRSSTPLVRILLGLMLLLSLALSLGSPKAHAQTYVQQTSHNFQGKPTDGGNSFAGMINVNGTLYGTTFFGGTYGHGSIFSISPSGSNYSVLYSFTTLDTSGNNTDGAYPYGTLISVNGILYGTAEYGGTSGKGVVFTFDPVTNTEKAICSFFGSPGDGLSPLGSLILVDDLLYGTTAFGGANNKGTIFSIDTFSHAEKIIYSFGASTSDAAEPRARLTEVNGILYGTTILGGSLGYGTVFAVDPITKTEHVLHTFTSTSLNNDGSYPYASLTLANGTLYGTTYSGGILGYGTVFCINTNGGGYQSLYSFTNSVGDGANPYAGLISISGKLFGTTYQGGFGNGTVFSWDPATEAETTLYRFTATDNSGYNADGANPYAGLLNINGTLYGTTIDGGRSGNGTLFSLTPAYPPTAVNHNVKVTRNATLTINAPGVLGNVNNGGSSPMTAILGTNVTHGTLALSSDGSFTYKPNTGFVGTDSFTYRAKNAVGTSNSATTTITVQPVAPIAVHHNVTVKRNATLTINAPGVLGNVDNGGGTPMTASLVANVTHGTLSLKSDGNFVYTPTTGFVGTDSFTYQAVNSVGKSNIASVVITVQATAPHAGNHSVIAKRNATLTINAPGVLGNVDNGGSSPMTAALVATVTHGTLSLKSDGSFVYTPKTGFTGTDSFTYQAVNSVGKSNVATTTLTVQ